ncbi:protein N-lysine methyltransferase METTL21A [Platichthys flesus]|uniref:protein N-lysine methyltransferase METTL21A n=1 Tax=Platichthys flesus TaxID=8260 RepID=UPI002DB619AC|nr:protein N-lysine methyltransferase METTL21A [Platichthys flesus]
MCSCVTQEENNMALVPYVENCSPLLSKLHSASAQFEFNSHRVTVSQDWRRHGVAAVLWDAAVVLSVYMEQGGELTLKGKRVIELGAGTGLAGIVAALLGAEVTVTDRASALDLLSTNVKSNLPPGCQGSATVSELTWGQGLDRYPAGGFDLVLGADIVYLEDTFVALLQTLEHLCSDATAVLLACKIRYERDTRFLELLKERFRVEEVHYDQQRDIHIYKAWKLPEPRAEL